MPDTDNTPVENPVPEQKKSKNGLLIGIIVLVLLLVIGFVYKSMNDTIDEANEKIISLEQAVHQSDSLYNELKHQLANYKQENEELYAQISRKESELENQYSKIKRLIEQAKRDKSAQKEIQSKLATLSAELDNMREYVDSQTLDLEELRVENRRLRKEKELLDEQYAEELATRERLEQEGEDLQNANEALQKKLNTASVLLTKSIDVKALRIRNNGEKKAVILAKRCELMEICINIVRNEVCPEGPNRFFMRIIDPAGRVLLDQNRGSGKLILFNNGEETDYTTSKIFDYNTTVTNVCIEWFAYPNTAFVKGTYQIELFNKGREVGKQSFTFK